MPKRIQRKRTKRTPPNSGLSKEAVSIITKLRDPHEVIAAALKPYLGDVSALVVAGNISAELTRGGYAILPREMVEQWLFGNDENAEPSPPAKHTYK